MEKIQEQESYIGTHSSKVDTTENESFNMLTLNPNPDLLNDYTSPKKSRRSKVNEEYIELREYDKALEKIDEL